MNWAAPQDRFPLPPQKSGDLLYKMHIDLPLFAGLTLLSGIGFIILYSAGGQHMDLLIRQATRLGIAFVTLFLLAQIHPRHLQRHSPVLFTIGICFLLAVLAIGEIGKGAQRWLNLGLFQFQPSEIIKISTPMMIAWYLTENPLPPRFKQIVASGILILIPTLCIAAQPDLGTSLLVAGMDLRHRIVSPCPRKNPGTCYTNCISICRCSRV